MKKCSDKTLRTINSISEGVFLGCLVAIWIVTLVTIIINNELMITMLIVSIIIGIVPIMISGIVNNLSDIELHARYKQKWYEWINSQIEDKP